MQDEHDYESETTSEDSILTFQGIIAEAILQMFIYLKEGYTLTEILEGNSSLRSAKIISPKLGQALADLDEILTTGVPFEEAEASTVDSFAEAIQEFGEFMVEVQARQTDIEAALSDSIDTLYANLVDGMDFEEAIESDSTLYGVIQVSVDFADAIKALGDEIATGTSVADAFDLYSSTLGTGLGSGATDLAEYEVLKMTKESEIANAVTEFIALLEEGYTWEDALAADETLDYAS
jgi:hypothetical protein